MKRISALIAALFTVGVGTMAANAPAHAAPSIASVVPSGCKTSWNWRTSTTDSGGNIVSLLGIQFYGEMTYSTSGASVGFEQDVIEQRDGKHYRVTVHRIIGNATYQLNGGDIYPGHSAITSPNYTAAPLWEKFQSGAMVEIAGYDVNRTSVGFHDQEFLYPCNAQ